jgi:biopolymer transport protein ExbB
MADLWLTLFEPIILFKENVRDFLELGGPVLVVIALVTFIMWGLIFDHLFYLQGSHRQAVQRALQNWKERSDRKSWYAHQIRTRLISVVSQGLERHLRVLKALVALCPLLGLLGTVAGMIEVFDVMAVAGSGNPRSMATGVSKAMITTMAGMVAALSGIFMNVYLQRRVVRERQRLGEQLITDHL